MVWARETLLSRLPVAVLPSLYIQQRWWGRGPTKGRKWKPTLSHTGDSEMLRNLSSLLCPPLIRHTEQALGLPTPQPIHTFQADRYLENIHGTNSTGKKKRKAFCVLDFTDFHLVPEVYGWPWHLRWLSTSTDWPLKPFLVSYRNSEWLKCNSPAGPVLWPTCFQRTCAVSFPDVSLKRCVPVFLWTQFWLSYS